MQVLVDEHRWRLLDEESQRTGRSVGSIVRGAIDLHFATETAAERRARAGTALLAVRDEAPGEDWAQVKAVLEADVVASS